MAFLLDRLPEAGADDQAAALAGRLPAAGPLVQVSGLLRVATRPAASTSTPLFTRQRQLAEIETGRPPA